MAADVRVAVVGTGRMGGAMAVRLGAAGYPVTAFNRTRARAEATGATVADTARAAAEGADVVLVSLPDDATVTGAYHGADGIAAGLRPGTVVLEMSTVAPATVRSVAPPVGKAGATLLDAPVSGSVALVEAGELTVMVGGDPGALQRARPVLDVLAAQVYHLGALGSGATMKLAVNSVLYSLNQGLAEALVLAERAGIARERAYEVFAHSAVAAPYVHYKRAAFEHPESAAVAFMLDLVAKDLDLIRRLAAEVGATMEQAGTNERVAREVQAAGWGQRDISAIAAYLRER